MAGTIAVPWAFVSLIFHRRDAAPVLAICYLGDTAAEKSKFRQFLNEDTVWCAIYHQSRNALTQSCTVVRHELQAWIPVTPFEPSNIGGICDGFLRYEINDVTTVLRISELSKKYLYTVIHFCLTENCLCHFKENSSPTAFIAALTTQYCFPQILILSCAHNCSYYTIVDYSLSVAFISAYQQCSSVLCCQIQSIR